MNLTDLIKKRKKKQTLKEKLESWWSYTKTYKIKRFFSLQAKLEQNQEIMLKSFDARNPVKKFCESPII